MSFSPGLAAYDGGHVAVCYSSDGSKIITGGSDGDIKIYTAVETSQEPISSFFADAFNVTKIRQWGESLAASSEGWSLQKWTFPDGNKAGFLGKFSGNVTHFSLNFDENKIVVGSAEFLIKLTGGCD